MCETVEGRNRLFGHPIVEFLQILCPSRFEHLAQCTFIYWYLAYNNKNNVYIQVQSRSGVLSLYIDEPTFGKVESCGDEKSTSQTRGPLGAKVESHGASA